MTANVELLRAENKRLANALQSLLRYVERCREAGVLVCDDIGPEEFARYELEQALSLPPEQPAAAQQGQAVTEDMGGFTSDTAALAFLHLIGNGNPNVERAVERLRQSLIAQSTQQGGEEVVARGFYDPMTGAYSESQHTPRWLPAVVCTAPPSVPDYPITATCRVCDYDYRCVPVPAKCGTCGSDLPPSAPVGVEDVDALAQEIRRVDGEHSLGASALAEALVPYLARTTLAQQPAAPSVPVAELVALAEKWHQKAIAHNRGLRDADAALAVLAAEAEADITALAAQHQEPKP